MSQKLIAGDRIYFIQNGRKLRAVVQDALPGMKARGEELLIPVARPRNNKRVKADNPQSKPLKVRWMERKLLRKLPE